MATHSIGTGGDFSSVQAWFDDIPSTLTEQRIGQVKNEELVSSGVDCLAITARTTTPSFNIILEAVSGGSFKDNVNVRTNALRYNASNGAALRSTTTKAIRADTHVEYMIIRNLQLKCDDTGNYDLVLSLPSANPNFVLENLIAEGANGGGADRPLMIHSGVTARNCVFIQRSTANSEITAFDTVSGTYTTGGLFVGCLFVAPSNKGNTGRACVDSGSTGGIYKNCVFAGFAADQAGGTLSASTDYNGTTISDGSSGLVDNTPDHNVYSLTYDTTLFVQPSDASSLHDFRLVAGNLLENAGVYDGTNSPNDISGTARSNPPDIGAWELSAAGGGTPVNPGSMFAMWQ